MSKDIIYVATTAVSGLIKIGKTRTDRFEKRMRILEANGYYNVAGFQRFFAIELQDYSDKEKLLHEIFSKHRVGDSELFALDQDLVRQLLLSFEGRVVYPNRIDKDKEFDKVSTARKQNARFSFYKKGMKKGDEISFVADPEIKAVVVGRREVKYSGQIWKLSPLTRELFIKMGRTNQSGAFRGATYWQFNGTKLKDLPDITES